MRKRNNKITKWAGEFSIFDKEAVWFIICTYLFTWGLWLAAFKFNGLFRIVGSFVPSIIGIIFIHRNSEGGLKTLLSSVKRYRVKWYVYLFVFLYTILSFLIPHLLTLIFQDIGPFQVKENIAVFNISNPLIAILYFVSILVAGGPLGEELGWRGFLLPQLEKRFQPLLAGIMVGIVWACWHLPMFLFNAEGYHIPFLLYLAQTVILSLICTWLYHTSGKSLLAVLLFHTMDNFVCSIAFPSMLNGENLYTVFYWSIQILFMVYIVIDLKRYNRCRKK